MTFRVGQKVVCVDATEHRPHVMPLVVGVVYEIERFGCHICDPSIPAVHLVGVTRIFADIDFPFGVYRFRPIVERKTDISIFTKMLIPEGVEA